MCGIFAYVGHKKNASSIVLDGLKMLEYRGYDSWGVAAKKSNGDLFIKKRVGKIGQASLPQFVTHVSIGHTRWATHGGVTQKNAHPHTDCTQTIALLHNGIIENYEEIKSYLKKKNHLFTSETDTEVAAHLIEEFLKREDFPTSVRKAFKKLTGMNAIVVLNNRTSEIVAAKNGSPLVVGLANDAFFIASDTMGILPHTKRVVFLEDDQMVKLSEKEAIFYSIADGEKIVPPIHTLQWSIEKTNKGKYKHFLMKEISEQPRVIKNISMTRDSQVKRFAKHIKDASATFMLGCGTASYAALSGVYLFSKIAQVHVNFSIGSEFEYLEDCLNAQSLVIPISQSGETIDVVEPVSNAKKRGAKIAAITNVLGSTLYRQSDNVFLLEAGPEVAVVGTKSFTAMVSTLLLTAYALSQHLEKGKRLLNRASKNIEMVLSESYQEKIVALAKHLKKEGRIFILGRGISYATALEAALKIKETSYTHAEGFAGGELKHGVIALIEKGTPCIVFAPNDETLSEIISNAQEVKARGGYIIGVGPIKNDVFDVFLPTDDVGEATILVQVVISQLLAYYLALAKGVTDPDKPRNLAKSVTVK